MDEDKSNKLKPFHESIVDELNRLLTAPNEITGSESRFRSICILITNTKIPKGHREISETLRIIGASFGNVNCLWLWEALDSIINQGFEATNED